MYLDKVCYSVEEGSEVPRLTAQLLAWSLTGYVTSRNYFFSLNFSFYICKLGLTSIFFIEKQNFCILMFMKLGYLTICAIVYFMYCLPPKVVRRLKSDCVCRVHFIGGNYSMVDIFSLRTQGKQVRICGYIRFYSYFLGYGFYMYVDLFCSQIFILGRAQLRQLTSVPRSTCPGSVNSLENLFLRWFTVCGVWYF